MSVVCVLAEGLCPSLIGRRKGGNQNIEKKSNESSDQGLLAKQGHLDQKEKLTCKVQKQHQSRRGEV
jgi:hypothetical protein